MITLFEKFKWWKKDQEEIDKTTYYSLEKPLTTFMEWNSELSELEIQRSVCRFVNDKLGNDPLKPNYNVIFKAVKVYKRNFPYDLCLNNKEWYDKNKEEFSYPFDGILSPMKGNIYLLTMTIKENLYRDGTRNWNIQSFLIHIEDLKKMLVDKEIKYNRIITDEDPLGEEDWD